MTSLLTLDNLSIGYQAGHPLASHINMTLGPSEVLALVGLNGTGKSTLLKTILGLVKPLSGEVKLGVPHAHDIAYLPQQARIEKGFPITLKEFVSTGLWSQTGWWRSMRRYDKEVQSAIERVDLMSMMNVPLNALSGGQLQRALFARMLLQPSQLLLLDEPFNGVDEDTVSILLEQLAFCQQRGASILIAIHDQALVKQHFDQCLLFQSGRAIQGSCQTLLTTSDTHTMQVSDEAMMPKANKVDMLSHA